MSELVLDREFFLNSLKNMSELIEKERNYLTKLDSEIGDGDHGINLSIGFREVTKKLDELDASSSDIATLMKKAGMTLLGKVGGASGPLYGSFFMKLGTDVAGKNEVTFSEFVEMLSNGVEAVQKRGKAAAGDKTMLDAFLPGIESLKNQESKETELEAFKESIEAMKQGAEDTIPWVTKKGRAMRLGERAIGHKDPGAESSWMLVNAFYEEMKKQYG